MKPFRQATEGAEYRGAWGQYLRCGMEGLRSSSRDLLANAAMEFRTYAGLNTGSASTGETLIPIGFQREIEEKMRAWGRMRNNCRVIPTSTGNPLHWPTLDDTQNIDELLTEAAPVSQLNPAFGEVVFSAYLLSSKQVLVSVQLLQDSAFDLEQMLAHEFAIRIGRLSNLLFTKGSGGGTQPTGLITAILADNVPNVVTAAGSQANDNISSNNGSNSIGTDDLEDLIAAVDPAYRTNGMFMMHWTTIDLLRRMKDKYGRPIWQASLAEGQPDRIYGYRYDWNADMDQVAAGNHTVLFGDFQKYAIRDVLGLTLVRYNELYMVNHQVGFQSFARVDGQRLQQNAFALLAQHT